MTNQIGFVVILFLLIMTACSQPVGLNPLQQSAKVDSIVDAHTSYIEDSLETAFKQRVEKELPAKVDSLVQALQQK